ncbi:type II secretion system protein [Massilia sp. LXY-6]|uniref:type IV pilus modification PilV family protein n=1 Tax=Massilia sp. LXY-6 TaxID=3379823 RepID=UPI003EE2C514
MFSERPPLRQRGVTMVELILFIVIVGIAVGGILTVMNISTRGSVDPLRRKQALIIAEGLLEEVELARFSYCDPADPDAGDAATVKSSADCKTTPEKWGQLSPEPTDAASGRPFDNVNDYVSAPQTWTAAFDDAGGVLVDANGVALGVSGYTARLTIAPASLNGIGSDTDTAADTDVLRITVQVSYDGGSVTLDGYRTRYAPNHL